MLFILGMFLANILSVLFVVLTSVKMPKGPQLSEGEIAMIISAICFFRNEGAQCNDKRYPVYQKASECVGKSLSTVKRCAASMKENEDNLPGGPKKKQCVRGRPKVKLDDFTLGIVRRSIYDFYLNKMYPTITLLHQKLVSTVNDFPAISNNTLTKIVHELGFSFKKLNKKPILMESTTIAAFRHSYLRKIKDLRSKGYKIFYTDETWCGQNHTLSYAWQENVIDGLNENFNNYDQYRNCIQQIYGWRGGFKTPSGAGKRIIILHIGSEDGFLPGAELCFIGKKNTGDYHNEMNSAHYEEWFKKVLGLLPNKSAIVIDQAPYHTMVDPATRNPTMSWRKDEIISFLTEKHIPLPANVDTYHKMTKAELIVHARPHFRTPEKKLEQIISHIRPDVEIVWLPVAHCELNPIELIWAYVKGKIAGINMANQAEHGRSMEVMSTLCKEALQSVTPDLWKNCIAHAKKIENDYWEKDHLVDAPIVEPVVVNLEESSTEYSDSDDDPNE